MTGYVYAIECGDLVKIGFSTDPKKRLRILSTGAPEACKLIGYAEGTIRHETEIHFLAAKERVRGEWFRKGPVVSLFLSMLPKIEVPSARRPFRVVKLRGGSPCLPFASERVGWLVETARIYANALGISQSRVSTVIFNDGKRLRSLAEDGCDVGTKVFERSMQWFSDNWPDGTDWPHGVARPNLYPLQEAAQ